MMLGWDVVQRYGICLARMRYPIRAPAPQKKTPQTHWSVAGVVDAREPMLVIYVGFKSPRLIYTTMPSSMLGWGVEEGSHVLKPLPRLST